MGTGLTCGFAATGDRGILQRAYDTLDEEIAKAPAISCGEQCSLESLNQWVRPSSALINNCYRDYAQQNAKELAEPLRR